MANLTRKYYDALASTMKHTRAYVAETDKEGFTREEVLAILDGASRDLSKDLVGTNPLFDRMRFQAACGVEEVR
jgi:uncharacterized protein YllA (UPF0747 family)